MRDFQIFTAFLVFYFFNLLMKIITKGVFHGKVIKSYSFEFGNPVYLMI